ncbi:MAG TPA: TIGR01777 family oxidoreductase [Chloroflexota bacterium]|nr:TIGR01777 family oxidoreductase [Chloroflexota bacterium]
MKITVTGATGFIGRHLVTALVDRGDEVIALSRRPDRAESALPPSVTTAGWAPPLVEPGWLTLIDGSDAVVNLAGESVGDRRWTAEEMERIASSRRDVTNAIVAAIGQAAKRPDVMVQASAIGYYGPRGSERLDEESPPGSDFLARVEADAEAAAARAEELGLRVVYLRTGIVLGLDGGALPRMAMPFKLFAGGVMGPPDQMISWIHIDDEVGLILFALDGELSGPVNATAPGSVSMAEFSSALGAALRRPVWVPALPVLMKLALGKRAEAVFASIDVVPKRALEHGYQFKYTQLSEALAAATQTR